MLLNVHKCKAPSFMPVKWYTWVSCFWWSHESILLFLIVAAYSFIHSCRIIPCLILSSLPLSQLSGHLLLGLIQLVWYHLLVSQSFITILYPAISFVLLSFCHPYSCRMSLFVLHSLNEGAPISAKYFFNPSSYNFIEYILSKFQVVQITALPLSEKHQKMPKKNTKSQK